MDTLILETKWVMAPIPAQGEYSSLLIDASCTPELNIGLSGYGNRCLILSLPLDFRVDFYEQKLENITTIYRKNQIENSIIIELTNNSLVSYFNDTIISLFFKIKDIANVIESTSVFVTTINEWCGFFAKGSNDKHDQDAIQGFFGELSVLNELLFEADSTSVNYILKSWRGPYDETYDFYLDTKNIEVKTKRYSKSTVGISNEFQLDPENDKGMELTVVSVEIGDVNGLTLDYIIRKIKDRIYFLSGDLTILFSALKNKNLTPLTFKDYDIYKFSLIFHITYDTLVSEFPKLIRSELSPSLTKINYNINLTDLNNLIIHKLENFNL
jgi:hypothetical protein